MEDAIPVIVTSFRDFELEERLVRIMAQHGFVIGERKIIGNRDLYPEEILITDLPTPPSDLPIIAIPSEAKSWDEFALHRFVQDQILPPVNQDSPGIDWPRLLLLGGDAVVRIREELIAVINNHGVRAMITTFDEREIRYSLIPTRRFAERERFARFAHARSALLILTSDPRELARAQSLIEYRRRVHPHLQLGFILCGGRRAERMRIAATFEPFPTFLMEDQREGLLRIAPLRGRKDNGKFSEILEWIGSTHGDSREHLDISHFTRSQRGRTPRRTGGAMAAPR